MDVEFGTGTVVRLRQRPSCAGQIIGTRRIQNGRTYWGVRMVDGSGTRMLPAAQLLAAAAAPDPMADLAAGRFGDPAALRRLLLHHRLTGRLCDVISGMDVTETEFRAYQVKPVVKLLASPSQGLLIADEIGLGKTIEAGLIWTELVARFDCCRLLVICPEALTEQWRLELRRKFSVDASIVDAGGLLDHLRREGEWSGGFALIAPLAAVCPARDWEVDERSNRARLMRLLDARDGREPLLDCVIFDEAQLLGDADTMAYAFGRRAIDAAAYTVLLSATPIDLHSEALRDLLRMLDPEAFESEHDFERLAAENGPRVAARALTLNARAGLPEIVAAVRDLPRGALLKIDRRLDDLIAELSDPDLQDGLPLRRRIAARLDEMSLLGATVSRTRRRDVGDFKIERRMHPYRWQMNAAERAFSMRLSDIVRDHAWTLGLTERSVLASSQRLIASSLAAAGRHWAAGARDLSVDDADADDAVAGPLAAKLAAACADPTELAALDRDDSKYACLHAVLSHHWRSDPGEKLVLFSSFRATLDHLAGRLRADGVRFELTHGGVKEERAAILDRLEEQPGPSILLTSEVGGAGLDIHFCRSLINYDLPWNPMTIERRIGRIDRIDQRSPSVSVASLICAGSIEEQIHDRLHGRLLATERTYGPFEAILGSEIATLEQRLFDPERTRESFEGEIQRCAVAIGASHRETQASEDASGLAERGDAILDRIEENRRPERRIIGVDLADYVHHALSACYPGSGIVDAPGAPGQFDVTLSASAHLALKQLLVRAGRGCTRLSRDPQIRAVFDRIETLPKSIERITAVHPLTRLATAVRQEAAQIAGIQSVVRVRLGLSDADVAPGDYAIAVEKWFVEGALRVDGLAYAGTLLAGNALDPDVAEQLLHAALRIGRTLPPTGPCSAATRAVWRVREAQLGPDFDRFLDEELARHDDRADTGLARLDRQRLRCTREVERRLSEWKRSGDPKRLRLIPGEQGKLERLLARLDQRREQLEAARSLSFDRELLGIAIVEVGES